MAMGGAVVLGSGTPLLCRDKCTDVGLYPRLFSAYVLRQRAMGALVAPCESFYSTKRKR